MLLLLLPLL